MALLPLVASVVLIGITSQYANGAGLDPDILRSRRQEDLKGCTLSAMDKCYSILPPDGTAPNTLVEEIGQVDGPQKCQAFCKDLYSNTCTWFMYDRTTKDCMLFSGSLNDLRADCNEIGYPREPSYDACDVVFSGDDGCYNFREDYCRFEFGLLDNLDDIETVAECQSACQYIQGCNYFMYDQPSKTCKLNTNVTTSRTCDIVHGTPEPNLQTCIDDGKLDWASESEENGDSSQSIANPATTPAEPIEYDYIGRYSRVCKNAAGERILMCKLNDTYVDVEMKYGGPKCKAACDAAPSCLAIGTHYSCDGLWFSDYDTALTEVPADLCKGWYYKNVADNQIFCDDIDNNDCGKSEPTNGCYVKRAKTA